MPVIIDELEIVSEPEQSQQSRDPTRPAGEPPRSGSERPPKVSDLLDVERWERRRELRVRAH